MILMFEENDALGEVQEAALLFIERHGNLAGFDLEAEERERVLHAAVSQGLIVWNWDRRRYELERAGHKWLIKYSAARKARLNVAA